MSTRTASSFDEKPVLYNMMERKSNGIFFESCTPTWFSPDENPVLYNQMEKRNRFCETSNTNVTKSNQARNTKKKKEHLKVKIIQAWWAQLQIM